MRLLLLLVAVPFAWSSFGVATLMGWGFSGDTLVDRLDAVVIALSVALGAAAMVCVLAALGRGVLSAWLVLGALPATAYVVALACSL